MDAVTTELTLLRQMLESGSLQRAYRALLDYILGLRTHFGRSFEDASVSGLYQGYLDMTYFALFPASLKPHGLKIAIVFNYEAFRFEAWLSGKNRKLQSRYWELLKHREWPGYRLVTPGTWVDSILEVDLVSVVDLDDPAALTATIEAGTRAFVDEIERALAELPPAE